MILYNTGMSAQRDVLVIGGGVIGLTTAYFLARDHGLRVTIAERGEPGREASWAGAGILPPASFERATTPFNRLLGLSMQLYPGLSAELQQRSGVDNGYRVCGGFELVSGASEAMVQAWRDEEIRVERIPGPELRRIEPNLAAELEDGYYLPDMAQVRNPRHLRALHHACLAVGVEIQRDTPIHGFHRSEERIDAALTSSGPLTADRYLIATGAWSDELLGPLGLKPAVFPMRGQIVLFNPQRPLLRAIVNQGKNYLVPRDDGRILAGSTEERAGFVKQTTAEALAELTRLAHRLVPALAHAAVETTWAGLRPATRDEIPFLGRVPGTRNLFLAAGHFRSGLMLSPATSHVMAQLLTDQTPTVALDAFALDRLG